MVHLIQNVELIPSLYFILLDAFLDIQEQRLQKLYKNVRTSYMSIYGANVPILIFLYFIFNLAFINFLYLVK